MNTLSQILPQPAIDHFAPATTGLTWTRTPEGFSGAVVWCGTDTAGAPRVALKGWPTNTPAERVKQIHLWQTHAAHRALAPALITGAYGQTVAFTAGRLWDASAWVPGAPLTTPTFSEVRAACEAVAQLHLAWPAEPAKRPCGAVTSRLRLLRDHQALFASRNTLPPTPPELERALRQAVQEIARLAAPSALALEPWAERAVGLRPCVRDLHSAHVFFQDGRVTGIIDYGAMAIDTPAGDLARLLGDFSNTAPSLFDDGLSSYRRAGGPLDAPDEFVRVLAATGTVCSLLGWLVRILVQREPITNLSAIAARLTTLLDRVQQIVRV